MKVSVLIPTHDRVERLCRVLDSLALVVRPERVELETIVCANACADGTEDAVRDRMGRDRIGLRLVREPSPGLNLARNTAMNSATGEVLAFLDDDVWVEGSWLGGLTRATEELDADLVAGKTTLWWGDVVPEWASPRCEQLLTRLDLGERMTTIESESEVVGANFACRRRLVERIGGFHPHLDRAGSDLLSGGDTEFARRALRAGAKAVFSPEMAVRHWVAPERIDRGYLARVARGRGRTRVALALIAGSPAPWRLARIAVAQVGVGLGWQLQGVLRRDTALVMEGLIVRKRGEGTLSALASPRIRARFAADGRSA